MALGGLIPGKSPCEEESQLRPDARPNPVILGLRQVARQRELKVLI